MNLSKTLVTCGCSFTQQPGWARHVADSLGHVKLINLAIGGGTNTTQINRINDFVLDNNHPFDVVWQVTFPTRTSNMRLPPDHPDVANKTYLPKTDAGFTYAQRSPVQNYVDGLKHVDILHDEYVLKRKEFFYADINNDISQLLCTMLLTYHLADRMLVFFGVDNVDVAIVEAMQKFLVDQQIPFVPYTQNLLDYVKNNNLDLAEDGWHPAQISYETYARNILIPAIQQQWK